MRVIAAADVEAALDLGLLIERLRQAYRSGVTCPPRQVHPVPTLPDEGATLEMTTAWQLGRHVGVRIATRFPGNTARQLPPGMGCYLVLDGRSGALQAMIDGPALTARRVAATSVLAAGYLARPDCTRLLMIGTGNLAPHLILAYAKVRPIRTVLVWGRNRAKADRLAQRLSGHKFSIAATDDLEPAVRGAEIVCCATAAPEPLVRGAWLPPGSHLDLVGGTSPDVREADDDAVSIARVFVDSREAAMREAGDIVVPLASGALRADDVAGDLYDLTHGSRAGRRFYSQVTLFKAVGTGLADLAAAQLTVQRA